jgi:hypothetical protein
MKTHIEAFREKSKQALEDQFESNTRKKDITGVNVCISSMVFCILK